MSLKFRIEIVWQEFESILQKEDEEAISLFDKLVKISNNKVERKKVLFALCRAYSIIDKQFSIAILKKNLRNLKIAHLNYKIILGIKK